VQFSKSRVQLRHLDDFNVTLELGQGKVDEASFALNPTKTMTPLELEVTRFLFDNVVANVEWVLSDPDADGQCRRAKVCAFVRFLAQSVGADDARSL
jgi:hypothetical protein